MSASVNCERSVAGHGMPQWWVAKFGVGHRHRVRVLFVDDLHRRMAGVQGHWQWLGAPWPNDQDDDSGSLFRLLAVCVCVMEDTADCYCAIVLHAIVFEQQDTGFPRCVDHACVFCTHFCLFLYTLSHSVLAVVRKPLRFNTVPCTSHTQQIAPCPCSHWPKTLCKHRPDAQQRHTLSQTHGIRVR